MKQSQKRNKTGRLLTKSPYTSQLKSKSLEEPLVSYTSRIRAIGNSRGVILNNQLIDAAGLKPDADIVVQAIDGLIYIAQFKLSGVNADLSTWDKQFKAAIRKGARPEKDLFDGLNNDFDSKEW